MARRPVARARSFAQSLRGPRAPRDGRPRGASRSRGPNPLPRVGPEPHRLERLRGAIVTQEDLALHEPWFRVIPSKGDRAVVVLNRCAPTAFALEELAFSKEDGRVLRVLPECARELRLGGVRIPEVDERVPEPEDGARVVRSDFEDCMKQQDGFFRMTVSPQLFRLLHDVS